MISLLPLLLLLLSSTLTQSHPLPVESWDTLPHSPYENDFTGATPYELNTIHAQALNKLEDCDKVLCTYNLAHSKMKAHIKSLSHQLSAYNDHFSSPATPDNEKEHLPDAIKQLSREKRWVQKQNAALGVKKREMEEVRREYVAAAGEIRDELKYQGMQAKLARTPEQKAAQTQAMKKNLKDQEGFLKERGEWDRERTPQLKGKAARDAQKMRQLEKTLPKKPGSVGSAASISSAHAGWRNPFSAPKAGSGASMLTEENLRHHTNGTTPPKVKGPGTIVQEHAQAAGQALNKMGNQASTMAKGAMDGMKGWAGKMFGAQVEKGPLLPVTMGKMKTH